MSRLSYNGVIHAALSLAKDADERPTLVNRDVYELLAKRVFPFLLSEYISKETTTDGIPSYDEADKLNKMSLWTTHERDGTADLDDVGMRNGAIKIVIGSGLWAVIHMLAMMVEQEPSNLLYRKAFNFVCRSCVWWVMCSICSQHWENSINDVLNATEEYSVLQPVKKVETLKPSEVFDWTFKIHNIASRSGNPVPAKLTDIRVYYLIRYKRFKASN